MGIEYVELRGKCHLLYMDDLKLLGRNEIELKNEMKIVQTISKDINMNWNWSIFTV